MPSSQPPKGQPEPGREYPPGNEQQVIDEMIAELKAQVERMYPKPAKMLRQIHPKMHGSVKARFTIEPGLPPQYRVGVFQEEQSFPAWVRFSNGNSRIQRDGKKDIRGAAIKLMGVPGEKILGSPEEKGTQDFIFLSSKAFIARNPQQFRAELKAATSPHVINLILYLLNPLHARVTALTLKSLIRCSHPMGIPYFSTVPFRFGAEDRAVKYHLRPDPANGLEYTDTKNPDFLRANMVATLAAREIRYDFCVQFQQDAEKMPIEDPTVAWDSPFIKLATLIIPSQQFDSPSQQEFGDNLSFNAWHALPDHRPLGGFNRVRRHIYMAMYAFRHDHNQIPQDEPAADEHFFDDTNFLSNG